MSDSILAWHFVHPGWKLRDGQSVIPGMITVYSGPLRMCESGLHASVRLIDALTYAPSQLLERVRCEDDVHSSSDKLVCRRRTTLWTLDAEWYLHEFACVAAELAIESSGGEPDPRSFAAIAAKRRWLSGDATDAELAAARAAAWAARDAAAWAARDAARAARDAAARDAAAWAARDAARDAAWDAAGDAAGDAAWDAAWARFNKRLTRLIMSAAWETDGG